MPQIEDSIDLKTVAGLELSIVMEDNEYIVSFSWTRLNQRHLPVLLGSHFGCSLHLRDGTEIDPTSCPDSGPVYGEISTHCLAIAFLQYRFKRAVEPHEIDGVRIEYKGKSKLFPVRDLSFVKEE